MSILKRIGLCHPPGLALTLLIIVATGFIHGAKAFDLYSVSGISVDLTDETASAAREKGLLDAQRRALRQVMSRLVLSTETPLLPDPPDEVISEMIEGYQIREEKTSAVRYVALIDYRFKPAAVREVLQNSVIPFAETRSKPVLVIPVYIAGGFAWLWEDPNPWRDAWASFDNASDLLPIITPFGDVADIADLSTQKALQGDLDSARNMAARYGAGRAVFVTATSSIDPATGQGQLQLSVFGQGADGGEATAVDTLAGGGDVSQLMAEGVLRVATALSDDWKRANFVRTGVEARLTLAVPIESFKAWRELKSTLRDMPIVQRYDVIRLARKQAIVDLWVTGDNNQVALALAQRNLKMIPSEPDWLLVPNDWEPPAPEPVTPVTPGANQPAAPLPNSTLPAGSG